MSKLGEALREKFQTPANLLKALGLDESLVKVIGANDSKEQILMKPTRLEYLALTRTATALNPLLAFDAKVEYGPVFSGLTSKNFAERKPQILAGLKKIVAGKLIAKDEDVSMAHVVKMLDHVGERANEEPSVDESVSEPQHKAMEAAAHGHSTLDIPKGVGKEFAEADKGKTFDESNLEGLKSHLKEKGMGEDDIKAACDALMVGMNSSAESGANDEDDDKDMTPEEKLAAEAKKKAAADESPEEKKKREEEEAAKKKAEDEKRAADEKKAAEDKAAKDAEMKDMVSKGAMDAALKANTDATIKRIRDQERGIRMALDEVSPWVGKLSSDLAFDSGDEVRRKALKMMGVDAGADWPTTALQSVLKAQPKPGAKQSQIATDISLGMDAGSTDTFKKNFPGAADIRVI